MIDNYNSAIARSSLIRSTPGAAQFTLRSGEVAILDPIMVGDARVPLLRKTIPEALFRRYMNAAMHRAHAELEDGVWFAEIPGFSGLWGEGQNKEAALSDLSEALDDWLILKIEDEDRDLPLLENMNLNVI